MLVLLILYPEIIKFKHNWLTNHIIRTNNEANKNPRIFYCRNGVLNSWLFINECIIVLYIITSRRTILILIKSIKRCHCLLRAQYRHSGHYLYGKVYFQFQSSHVIRELIKVCMSGCMGAIFPVIELRNS